MSYQNHKRKSNPSKQSGSVNIDWTGGRAVVEVRGAMDRQFFSQGFHVAFGQIVFLKFTNCQPFHLHPHSDGIS